MRVVADSALSSLPSRLPRTEAEMFRALGVTKEGFGLLKQDVVSEAARAAQTTCLLFTGVRILQVNRPETRAESGTTPARDFRLVMCMCDAQLPERKKGATATGYNSTDALRRAVQKHFCAAGGLHNAYLHLDDRFSSSRVESLFSVLSTISRTNQARQIARTLAMNAMIKIEGKFPRLVSPCDPLPPLLDTIHPIFGLTRTQAATTP